MGPYPWSVKQRVMGRMGHLSNDAACSFIRDELDTRTSTLILGHISEHNNHPAIVRHARRAGLERPQLVYPAGDRRPPPRHRDLRLLTSFQEMIPRYTRPEMGRIFSDQNRFEQWLEVELAASEALAETGEVPREAAASAARPRRFRRRAHPRNRARGQARRHRLHHRGLRAHGGRRTCRRLALAALRADLERRGRYRASPGVAAGFRAAARRRSRRLAESLERRACEFKDTVQIGRTHGIHAEPITFGLKLALWYRRDAAQHPAPGSRGRGSARGQNFGRRRHLRPHRPRSGGEDLRRGWASSPRPSPPR